MAEPITPKYDAQGLVPAILQDADTGQVLMMAWMNAEALRLTLETRQAHFWSRSRQELWRKGATSGNIMEVVDIAIDCDTDTLLLQVHPNGPACHTGNVSCFFRKVISE
jgi:phosphoribosyl-AMP cyclohydrolase